MYFLCTGLKEVQDKVSNYSALMKDFPIHELHTANDLGSIRAAVVLIYNHMRKMRTTSYPAQRAIHLVEAISRDLNAQLLKVSHARVCMRVCVHVCVHVCVCACVCVHILLHK